MDEQINTAVAGQEAYVVGGAVRDELLGREVVDLDVACSDPEGAARAYSRVEGGAVFPLSERHGAWRVAFRSGRTVDFTPLRDGIEADLASRDFTINAIARPVEGGEPVDPHDGRTDLEARVLRAVAPTVFVDDPLRLLRAVRLEDELGFRLDDGTERLVREHATLVTKPAGERILGELERLSPAGFRRAEELGVLGPLGGSTEKLEREGDGPSSALRLVLVFEDGLERFPISNELKRFVRTLVAAGRPEDDSPRALHRFRRATEPWALEALAFLDASELAAAVQKARADEPAEPLLRGDELGVAPGPEVGRLLALIDEERAAGTIATREEALELVKKELKG
jgi:hypothetical protein